MNEVNRKSFRLPDGGVEGQPTWNKPRRAAEYYMAARKVFRGAKIVALDILDENNVSSGAAVHPHLQELRQAGAALLGPAQLLGHQPVLHQAHEGRAQGDRQG